MPSDYRQGMIDGLELADMIINEAKSLEEATSRLRYYLKLTKEDKFEKIRIELGVFK